MTIKPYSLLALLALGVSLPAAADMKKAPATKVSLQQCLATALSAKDGKALQVVLKSEGKEPVWEFEIAAKDGKYWDVECSGKTGKVVEIEERVMSADDPAFKAMVMDMIPLRQLASPQDVADAVVFLASDRAGMITGDSLKIDGGWTAR